MTMSDAHLTDLLSQHTLQSDDLQLICELAAVDDLISQIEYWSFEQFFGLTVYMFVTTESPYIRRQLAELVPKFGSRAVTSLVKILHRQDLPTELRLLAMQALEQISPYELTYGLSQFLGTNSLYEPFVLRTLASLVHERSESILLLLSQLMPSDRWLALEPRLLERLPSDASLAFDESMLEDEVTAEGQPPQCELTQDAFQAA
ncbi:MAG: hypothetical protein AAFZ80_07085 [Cyanobacteria bacterium P01_A01_bin.105]